MNLHDQIPVNLLHLLEGDVTEDTGVVDDDVDSAEGINSGLDNLVTELNGVLVSDSDTTGSLDLINDGISGVLGLRLVLTLNRTAEIVNNDLGTTGGKKESILAAETITSAGHNSDLTIEANVTHYLKYVSGLKIVYNLIEGIAE